MLFNTKFDLIFSIGEDCACSSYLRRCKLQNFSYPFDWLTKASFTSRLELILNNFSDFLVKEDLYPIKKPRNGIVDNKCDYWADKRHDFYFYHDFPAGEPFDAAYIKVKEKYDRRIKRLYEQIYNSKTILLVWWSRDKHQDIKSVEDYYEKIAQKFLSCSVYLLIIECGEEEETYLNNKHILISKYDNISYKHNKDWNEMLGNEINNLKVFTKIKMNRTVKWRIKYLIYCLLKLFIAIVPIKYVRGKLRQSLNVKYYKEAL